MLNELQVKALCNELANIAHARNAKQYSNERAALEYYKAIGTHASAAETSAAKERENETYNDYEYHNGQLGACMQLLRRVFGIDTHYKENECGYIIEITVELTPHIGDSLIIPVNIQGYIQRWTESEKRHLLIDFGCKF